MTLILALKWLLDDKECVVMSSDSKVTAGIVSYEAKKVYPITLKIDQEFIPLAIFGGSGDATIVKQSYRICEKILIELAEKEWGNKTPSFNQFESSIKEIEASLIKRYRELKENNISDTVASLILASVDTNGKASIYVFDERGLADPVHDNPGYAVIGSGFYTGGNMLLKLLGYGSKETYTLDLGALSTFIIDTVSEVDSSVGPFVGESYLMGVEEGKVVINLLSEEALKKYKEKTLKRKEIIKRMWRLLDTLEEQKIEEKIEELEKYVEKEKQEYDIGT